MRIDLTAIYDERHTAKALGASWDAFKRCWYVIDPQHLIPFLRWVPSDQDKRHDHKQAKPIKILKRGFGTTPSPPVAACGCDVLSWEDCLQTATTIKKVAK